MDGIVILDKDSGLFSRTAGYHIAKLFNEKKFGHIGTLDPMASGVLPIAIGNATKMIPFIEEFVANRKEYLFGLKFGVNTDSLDITGNIIETNNIIPDEEEIKSVCDNFIGITEQIPPTYSAIHVNGRRAYEMARNGENIEMKPREVTIYELEYLGKTGEEYNFRVLCERGTYVRSIVRDIAKYCGAIATTTYIKRTMTNGFLLKNAVKLDFLENLVHNGGDANEYLLSSDCALGDIPVINLSDEEAKLYKNGGFIKTGENDGFKRIYANNEFIGIGYVKHHQIRPKRTL